MENSIEYLIKTVEVRDSLFVDLMNILTLLGHPENVFVESENVYTNAIMQKIKALQKENEELKDRMKQTEPILISK